MSFSPYTFEFLSGKYEGGRFRFPEQKSFSIGRESQADFVLVEEMVSRLHARITVNEEHVLVEDIGSSNGTYLNGKKIKQATPIQLGDKLLIGKSILRLSLYEPTAEIELIAHPPAGDFEIPTSQSGVTRAFSVTYLQDIVDRNKKKAQSLSGVQRLNELFPNTQQSLTLKKPLNAELELLSARELRWLQALWNTESLENFLQHASESKEEAADAILSLWDKGFLMPKDSSTY